MARKHGFKKLNANGKNSPYWIFSFEQNTVSAYDSGGFQVTNNGVLANGSTSKSTFWFQGDSAVMIGESVQNRGQLAINFIGDNVASNLPSDWNASSSQIRKALLDFNATTNYDNGNGSRSTSFVGNLSIRAGLGKDKNIVEGNFAGDMIVDVYILAHYVPSSGKIYTDVNATLTFQNNASLQGNIYSNLRDGASGGAGTNIFNFQTGGIYGGLYSGTFNPESMASTNTINFNIGGTPTSNVINFIEGDVVAQPGGNNIINFNRDNDARIRRLVRNSGTRGEFYNGKNQVTFQGSVLTISRGIATEGSYHANDVGNQITLKKKTLNSQSVLEVLSLDRLQI